MSLNEIEKELRKQSDLELDKINCEEKKTIETIRKEIKNAADMAYEQTKLKKSKEYDIELKKIVSDARMTKKNQIALKKAEMLGMVFSRAEEKIRYMADNDKREILENLVKDKNAFPNSIVLIDKRYSSLLKDAKPADLHDFGIVVESKDGSLRIDRTLPKLMSYLRKRLEPEIVKILFK